MKTIYLACQSTECLIADVRKVFTQYAGETEYSNEIGAIHLIGDIYEVDTEGNIVNNVGKQHANVYVQDEFDETIFETRMLKPPGSPVNRLAI